MYIGKKSGFGMCALDNLGESEVREFVGGDYELDKLTGNVRMIITTDETPVKSR